MSDDESRWRQFIMRENGSWTRTRRIARGLLQLITDVRSECREARQAVLSQQEQIRQHLRENTELQTDLGDALQLAEEGWAYASPNFRQRWNYEQRLWALRKNAGPPTQVAGVPTEKDHVDGGEGGFALSPSPSVDAIVTLRGSVNGGHAMTETESHPRAAKVMVDDCKSCPFMHVWSNNWFCYHPLLAGKPILVTSVCAVGGVHQKCLLVGQVLMVAGPAVEDFENQP